MPNNELKPTTADERERWKEGHRFQPVDQSFTILRLIADVEWLHSILATIEAKSQDEPGALMHSINRLAKEALNAE